ncbi:MAG TPA: adenosine deaminase [Gemmatimonadota bacterium]|nr:adenosine deaminase [Gemmatimonadota bacterium]
MSGGTGADSGTGGTPGGGDVRRRDAGGEEAAVREAVRSLPKTDLHVHLDGSLRPGTLLDLADEHGVELPTRDLDELGDYLHVRDARNLEDYLARFELTLSVMQHADALERIARELCEDAAAENVRYMEIRYSPILLTREGLPLPEAVEAPLRGLERAREELGIESRLILCGIRNMEPDVSRDLADLTVAYKEKGVVGFDLAGAEYNYPAKKHRNAFYTVLNANCNATIHAGEAYGPESIHQALHYCGAHRIGHGTRLFEDPELERYVADHRVPLEICLTSNVQTRVVEDFPSHPVRRYFDRGLVVSLNTDNRLMSGTTVTEEYVRAWRHMDFTLEEIGVMVLNGFRSAFLHHREREVLLAAVGPQIAKTVGVDDPDLLRPWLP